LLGEVGLQGRKAIGRLRALPTLDSLPAFNDSGTQKLLHDAKLQAVEEPRWKNHWISAFAIDK
jgi:hypothetical protein